MLLVHFSFNKSLTDFCYINNITEVEWANNFAKN
jgi:hypothetical protein